MQAIRFLKHYSYAGRVGYVRFISCMFQNLGVFPSACGLEHFCFANWMAYNDTVLKLFILFPLFTPLCNKFQHRTINVEKP